QIGVGRAVPITCTYPLFSILWAILFGQGPVTVQAVFGAVAIVIGIWLLSQSKATHNVHEERNTAIRGIALSMATAIVWSVSISMIGMAVEESPNFDYALTINALRLAAIAVSVLLLAPVIDRNRGFLKMPRKALIALISGGIVALALGWFLLTYSFINTAVSQAVPISSTTPLFSTLVALLFLNEKITVKNAVGSIIIVIGIFIIFVA
ncbi:MAG: DMT family transporter, partial [Candidatus Thorarchaeota archaeon]|nr:DMT family transporter [Candidatus Thorarchaeota archaeon]